MSGPPSDPAGYESVADRRIREAMERGEFDDLPGAGRPIADLDRPYDPSWWARRLVERERLGDRTRAHLDQVTAEIAAVWRLPTEDLVRTRIDELNRALADLDRAGGEIRRFDPDEIVRLWRRFAIHRRRP